VAPEEKVPKSLHGDDETRLPFGSPVCWRSQAVIAEWTAW
jgi:hypothetical protein